MNNQHAPPQFAIDYGEHLEVEIERVAGLIALHTEIAGIYEPRWLAVKLLEGERDLTQNVTMFEGGDEILEQVDRSAARLAERTPDGVEIALADRRYEFISQVIRQVLVRPGTPQITPSEKIDRIVTHPWLGLPIFFVVMYLVFNLVVNVSAPYLDWIDGLLQGPVTNWAASALALLEAPGWLQGLILDGIIAGVGGVLVFVPGLSMLFLFIGLLEDSGYLARAAVLMDRFMNILGLQGKSFVPMILGFGCAVPAIYATRTLENRRDRILTALLVPLMSCSARLPVYVVFGMAFFEQRAELVIWGLYALGVVVAAVAGILFSRFLFRRTTGAAFVMELPAYSLPTARNLWIQVSQRMRGFLRNAGTVILLASVAIWLLLNLPLGAPALEESWFAGVGSMLVPVLRPAGFGAWQPAGALVSGLVAKEVVVSTLSQIYMGEDRPVADPVVRTVGEDLVWIGRGFMNATLEAGKEVLEVLTPGFNLFEGAPQPLEERSLRAALTQSFSPLSALAFLVFVLLYVPCAATLGTMRGEFGWRWALFAALWQTGAAWCLAVLVFQVGRALGFA